MKFHVDGTLPTNNEIFVFGSNLAGRHGAGAAKVAAKKFGAINGVSFGPAGRSFAIPTKDASIRTLPLEKIKPYVDMFLRMTSRAPDVQFFVTSIGCGLAGYTPAEIAPMFKGAPDNCSFPSHWQLYLTD